MNLLVKKIKKMKTLIVDKEKKADSLGEQKQVKIIKRNTMKIKTSREHIVHIGYIVSIKNIKI